MTDEQRAGCYVLRLAENNTGLPGVGNQSVAFNCDGTKQHLPRPTGFGFGPTAYSPAYEWKWVLDCEHDNLNGTDTKD